MAEGPRINIVRKQEAAGAGGTDGGSKKKSKLPLWIIILVVSQVVIVGGGFVAYRKIKANHEAEIAEAARKKEAAENAAKTARPIYPLEPFVVNITADGPSPKHLNLGITFELESMISQYEMDAKVSQVRDEIVLLITTKKAKDLLTPEGRKLLQDEIFTRANKILVKGHVASVYFTEYFIE